MSRRLGLVAAALTGVQVGLALVVTRGIYGALGPTQIAVLRYAIGAAVLLPFFLAARFAPLARRDVLPVLGLGVIQFGLLIALLNASVTRITAGQASVIFATFPLLTMALAVGLRREAFDMRKLVGAAISVLGVALCLGVDAAPADPLGVAMALGAAGSGAVCAILYRPYLARYPTLQVGTLAMIAAVAALLLPGLLEGMPELPVVRLVWAGVLFIGLSSGAGYLLWLTALRHAAATEATFLLGLSPIVASLAGALWLDEPLTAQGLAGVGITLGGIALALSARRLPA